MGQDCKKFVLVSSLPEELTALSAVCSGSMVEIESCGFQCAEKAVNHIRNNKTDGIITDLILPDMTGVQLLYKLKSDLLNIHPFILCSGSNHGFYPIIHSLTDTGDIDLVVGKPKYESIVRFLHGHYGTTGLQ